jgi:hypothetical protein
MVLFLGARTCLQEFLVLFEVECFSIAISIAIALDKGLGASSAYL